MNFVLSRLFGGFNAPHDGDARLHLALVAGLLASR